MQRLTLNTMDYVNTEIADEKAFLEIYMQDEMDEMGYLDMSYSLELALTGDYEDL